MKTIDEDVQERITCMNRELNEGMPLRYQPFTFANHMPAAVCKKVERKKPSVDKQLQGIHTPQLNDHEKTLQVLTALTLSQKKSFELMSSHSKRRFNELEEQDQYFDNYLTQNEIVIGDAKIKEKVVIPRGSKVNRKLDFDSSLSTHVEDGVKPFEEIRENCKAEDGPSKINSVIRTLRLNPCDGMDDYIEENSLFEIKCLDMYADEFC